MSLEYDSRPDLGDCGPEGYAGLLAQGRAADASVFGPAARTGRRIRHKGEEARHAIGIVLQALECDVSLDALERALATVKAHLEAAHNGQS